MNTLGVLCIPSSVFAVLNKYISNINSVSSFTSHHLHLWYRTNLQTTSKHMKRMNHLTKGGKNRENHTSNYTVSYIFYMLRKNKYYTHLK